MTTVSPVSPALSQSSTGSKTKKRKQRKVYGAYVDIDNVDQKPGDSFSNWIGLTKEKLRERESALMKIRMGCIKDAIFNAIILFNNNPGNTKHGIKINEQCCKEIEPMINNKDIINSCMNALNGILNQWNGIDLTRSNKEFDTYRQYFVVSKNWFDQRKKDILSKFLWAKILYLIREFSDKAANQFFNTLNNPQLNMMENQSNYRRSLVLSILIKLFESKTQFTATKPQPLIPGGTIKDTKSIKEFFTNFVDPSLTIQQLIKNNTLLLTANKGKDLTAKQTLQLTLDRLRVLSMESQLRLSNNYLSMNKIEIMKTGTPSLTTTTTTTITSSDDQMSSLSSSRPLSRQPNINQNVNDNNDDSNHSNGYIQNFNNKNNENNIKLYTTTYSQQQPILANLSSITSISSNATSTSTSTPTTVNSNNSGTMDLCDMIKPSLITCSDYNYSNNNNNNYVKSDINNDNNQNNFNFVPSNMSNLVCDTNNIGMESTKIDNNFSVNNNYSVNNNNINYNNYNNNTNGNTNYSINNIHINNININNNNGYCCNNKQSMNNMNNMNAFNDTNNNINNINNNIVNNTYNNNNNNEYSEYNKYYPNVCVPTNNNNDNNTWNTTNSNINNVSVSNVNINNMNALSELFNQQGILNGYGYGPVHSSSNSTAQNRYNPLSNTSTNINNINNDNINYAVGNNYNNNNNNNHNCDTNTNGCNCNFHHHDHQYRQDYNNKYVQQQSYSHLQHSQHQSCSSYNNNNANNHNNCNCNGCTYNNTYNNY